MKKSIMTIAALALVFSTVSCKENTSETTIESDEIYETPAEVIETPVVDEIDTTVIDSVEADTTIIE